MTPLESALCRAPAGTHEAISKFVVTLLELGDEGVSAMREGIAYGLGVMREADAAETASDPVLPGHLRYYEALDKVLTLLEADSNV
jgi:hypothetical protein